MKKSDVIHFLEIRNSVRMSLHDTREFALSEAIIWHQNLTDQRYVMVVDKKSNNTIGYFRMRWVEKDNLQIGLDIHPNFQGLGFGKKAYKCLFNHWSAPGNLRKFSLYVIEDNTRALNLYLKLGFQVRSSTEISHRGFIKKNIYMERDFYKLTR